MVWISCIAALSYLVLLSIKTGLALREFYEQQGLLASGQSNGQDVSVAIVQPILSGDPLLPKLLRTNAENVSGKAQLIWAIDRADAVAQAIVVELAAEFPQVIIEQCPPSPETTNPKIFKLQRVLDRLGEAVDLLVVLDDDTVLTAETLAAAISRMASPEANTEGGSGGSKLFTGLPHYANGDNLWSNLVASFVNNNSALTYLPLLNFGPPVSINGMFYVLPVAAFRKIGGFRPVESWLCDDFAVKEHVTAQGWQIEQGVSSATVQTRVRDGRHYIQLMHRWMVFGRLLFEAQTWSKRLGLGLFLAMPAVLLLVATLTVWASWISLACLIVVLAIRWWMLKQLSQRIFGRDLLQPGLSLLAEWLQPLHVMHSLFQRTIQWRKHRIVVQSARSFRIVG